MNSSSSRLLEAGIANLINPIPTSVKRMVPIRLKRWLLAGVDRLAGRGGFPVQGQRPRMLSVEPTSNCNLNCPFCLVGLQNSLPSTAHDLLPRGFGFMAMELYEKIVRDAAAFGIHTLQLHFQGEPLLHKQFPEMVRLAKAQGLRTQAFTNGLPLTEALAERIIEAGLDMLRFSVDGVTEETYQKNRVGGIFARVYENMAMMARLVRARRSPMHLQWQMIALSNNEHEIPRAKKMARELGIPFFVKTFAVTDAALVPRNPAYQRQMHLKPCLDIYRSFFAYWNGDVVVCCYDQTGENVVGNLGRQSLEEIWGGSAYTALRHRIDNAAWEPDNEPAMCKSCLKWSHEPWRTSDGQVVWSGVRTTSRCKDPLPRIEKDFV